MLSLVSVGLTLLPARRKGKKGASTVSAAFYGVRGGVHGQNSIGHSHWMKCIISKLQRQKTIPALNNGLKFFLLQYSSVNKVRLCCYHLSRCLRLTLSFWYWDELEEGGKLWANLLVLSTRHKNTFIV